MNRYIGRIATIPGNDGYAFIGLRSVTREDGSEHGLQTTVDIFLHRDECADPLRVGMEVIFDVTADRKRSEDALRAVGASRYIESELLPVTENVVPGFAVALKSNNLSAFPARLPVHAKMKPVPAEMLEKVVANNPLPGVPRDNAIPDDDDAKSRVTAWLLEMLFPHLAGFGTDYRVLNYSDDELNRLVRQTNEDYSAMGLMQEVEVLSEEVKKFRDIRAALAMLVEENLIRPDTVIPVQYLPDLFMAVPVWYYWFPSQRLDAAEGEWSQNDPKPHENVVYFCDLFPNQAWCDTFQLFNRRVRTLRQYKGEVIPPAATRRMRQAIDLFDFVVIATPYHDQAGKDWTDLKWLRAIDPYILGFKKGIPFFFVLARFSDTGTFPLYNDLVADTIEFLRTRKSSLQGFNAVTNPYWYQHTGAIYASHERFGDYLIGHVESLLQAFEGGNLFDWLRGE